MFPFSPLTTDWKEITQWLVNVSWLYPILQWGRTSGKRHSEPKALNPWTKGRVQSATDAEEVRARSLSREILIRARASWGRPSRFSPTQEFLAAEGVLSVQGRVSVNKPPSPGHPHPHPTPQQLQGTVWRTEQGETALSRPSRASSSCDPQENTDNHGREGEACHEGSWGCSEGSTGRISTERARQVLWPQQQRDWPSTLIFLIPGAFTSLPHSWATEGLCAPHYLPQT